MMLIWFAGYECDVKLIDWPESWPPALDRKVRLGSLAFHHISFHLCCVIWWDTLSYAVKGRQSSRGKSNIKQHVSKFALSSNWVCCQVRQSLKCCNVMDSFTISHRERDSLHHFKTVKLILSSFFMHRLPARAHLSMATQSSLVDQFSFTFSSY